MLAPGPHSTEAARAALPTLDSSDAASPPATDGPPADTGQRVGRYRTLRVLGQGGAGVVYSAYDQLLDRIVALKTVRTDRSAPTDVGRFIREAKALARLSHPNVVPIHDVSIAGGQVFLAMELVRGRTLRRHLAETAGLGHAAVVALFVAAGQGLAAVHRAGLIHRDFKPDNVMVGEDGRVRVLDFGLVRDARGEPTGEPEAHATPAGDLTATGGVLGTPAYMAPEQHRGGEADARSDVFSFCASLYEALYGERPFAADSYEGLRAATLAGEVRPPAHARVPAWLREVVLRGLQAAPERRWPAMEPLLAALAADPEARRRRLLRRLGLALTIAAITLVATLLALQLRRAWRQQRGEALAAEHLAGALSEAPERADAAFAAFVDDPAHRGTRALAGAWLRRGDRRRDAGQPDAALADYARAYVEAAAPDGADEALRRIAAVQLGRWDSATLSQVVAALPAARDDRDTADLRVEAALRRRDLQAAVSLAADPASRFAGARPLLRRLTPARALGLRAREAVALPAGGPWSAAVVSDDRHELVLLDPALRPGPRWRADANVYLTPGAAPWALTRRGDDGLLIDVTRPEPALAVFPAPIDAYPYGVVDARGDGRPALYFGFQWPLRGFHAVGPAGLRGAHEATARARSDLDALVAADLDADGVQEIVAAFGPPRAFDLRVFHADDDGGLTLIGRRQFGWIRALGALRRPDGTTALVALRDSRGVNADVFPEPPHHGAAPGVHLLRWTGRELTSLAHAPPPHDLPLTVEDRSLIADLDGDGRDELAVRVRAPDDGSRHTLLVRQTADGALEPLVLGHCEPLAAVRAADDDVPALLVLDAETKELWALGRGDAPMPPAAARTSPSPPPPPTDEPLRQRWTRAEDLAVAGMPASAAEVLRDGAAMVADAELRRRFRDRAAALFAAAGQPEAALALDVGDPAPTPDALLRRASLHTELGAHAEAAAAARALLDHPRRDDGQAQAAAAILGRVTPLLDARAGLDLRFDAALAPAWHIERPAALRLDPVAGALRIDALAGQGRLASLPVRWDGGPLEIEVDLEVERAEYNSALRFALVDAADEVLLGVDLRGGGDRTFHNHGVACVPTNQIGDFTREVPSAVTRHRVVMRATYFPDRGVIECAVDDDGRRTYKQLRPATRPGAGRHTLVIGGADPHASHRVTALLRGVRLRGARLDAAGDPPAPGQAIARALVEGDAPPIRDPAALADPRHALLALLVADSPARPVAPEVLARALPGLGDADLLHLLRTRASLAPALRAAAGPRALAVLAAVWLPLARHHADDPALQRELLAALGGLEALALDDSNRRAIGTLLHVRAQMLARLGRRAAARRDLEAALVAFAATADPPGEPLRAIIHRTLAALLVDDDPAAALAHTARAVACDEAPELAQDRLRREPRILARAAADPAWARVLAAPPEPATCSPPARETTDDVQP
ncbi:MAG: protein kinase [Myxococcales bacterium]|nr:protein kinase [Myxococcales bacterium]